MNIEPIKLLEPAFDKIELAFNAFENRKTVKTFIDKKLPLQILSNLLWAACGVNRKTTPSGGQGRTAGSASNSQEIDIYTIFNQGGLVYD